jgi:hypothetical protein
METYYNIPQFFANFQKKSPVSMADLETSVKQHLNLLIMTRIRSYRFDENYGTIIWERDFESTIYTSSGEWCEAIKMQLYETIRTFEHRVVVEPNDVRVEDQRIENRSEKCIQITVNGWLKDYQKSEFKVEFLMNVSPLITLEVK